MIKIDNSSYRDLATINSEHYLAVYQGIITRTTRSFNSKTISKCQHDFIQGEIKNILTGAPSDLVRISNNYIVYCNARRCTNVTKGLAGIFAYRTFAKKNLLNYCAYDLAAKLDVRVCPYCNRQYTFTVLNVRENISRPEFDHFFSQEKYPLLSMSFYNLIPSCKICNSTLKHTKQFTLARNIHPYQHGFDEVVRFNYNPNDAKSAIGLGTNMEITCVPQAGHTLFDQYTNNVRVFKIAEIYQGHTDIVAEIVRKFYMSDGKYLEVLFKSFPQIGSYEELYRLAFGNYLENKNLDQRILAKLTKDIVQQLDFILPVKIGAEEND